MKHFLAALALAFAGITLAGVPASADGGSPCAPGVECGPPPCHVKPAACPFYGPPATVPAPVPTEPVAVPVVASTDPVGKPVRRCKHIRHGIHR